MDLFELTAMRAEKNSKQLSEYGVRAILILFRKRLERLERVKRLERVVLLGGRQFGEHDEAGAAVVHAAFFGEFKTGGGFFAVADRH